MTTPQPQPQPKINLPNIPVSAVEGFSKVWKSPAGLTLMLDAATKQFALDFARVVLRNFIVQNIQAANAAAKAKEAVANVQTESSPVAPSSIILTG
jgi:hypothetical protein